MLQKEKKKESKNKINYHLNKEKIKKIFIFIGWSFLITLFAITISRTTVIGQGIHDIFRLFFGWTQYLIFILILFLFCLKINFFKKKFQIKAKRQKKNFWKIFWLVLNFYWTLGLITTFVLISIQNKPWHEYSAYTLDQIIPFYYQEWTDSSIYNYNIKDAKDFFDWHKSFAQKYDGGGIIGLILASLSCYLQVIGGAIFNLISWFFLYSYIKNNSVLYYFKNYEKKKKIKWENLNEKQDYKFKTNTIDEIEDQDITIEMDTAKKIHIEEKKNNNSKNEKPFNNQTKFADDDKTKEIEITEFEITSQEKNDIEINQDNDEEENFFTETENQESKIINVTKESNLPNANLFDENVFENEKNNELNKEIAEKNLEKIHKLFQQYGVKAKIEKTQIGSRVTRYVISLDEGVKVQKILDLEPELKLILATKNLRMEAPIANQSAVGLEIPNIHLTYVNWKEIAEKLNFKKNSLFLGIGKNLTGEIEIIQLEEMPHLLVAGSTGGGKSICLLTLISSLIFQKNPEDLKLLLIDPKRVELTMFRNIPHLIAPVITDCYKASNAFDKILDEIEKRYKLLEEKQVNNIKNYNELVDKQNKLPFIVIVIDELADLILIHKQKIEKKIVRVGQIARAVGVFMILATQRPSNDIITGLIKTNIPGRIAFNVTNHNDSRTILNSSGAEKLLGKGDLLLKMPGQNIKRIQGALISINDIKKLTNFWKEKNLGISYWKEFSDLEETTETNNQFKQNGLSEEDEKLYEEIKMFLETIEDVSISLVQRKFNLGFNRAARLFEKLEKEEIISKNKESKNWKIIHDKIKFK